MANEIFHFILVHGMHLTHKHFTKGQLKGQQFKLGQGVQMESSFVVVFCLY